ncbi:sodium/hydrogen exchanger 3, partial [Sphaeroforma arctica JP610]
NRCGDGPAESKASAIVFMLVILLTSVTLGNVISKYKFPYLPESGMFVIVGVASGFIAYKVFGVEERSIDEDTFFLYLLPPIIFQSSAFAPSKTLLFSNLPSIIVLAVIGTVMCMLIIGALVFVSGLLPATESLLWGSLISAVDPIAVLAVFSNYGIDPQLSCIVFGESMANDGVAVVLFQASKDFLNLELSGEVFNLMVSKFFKVFFGSTLIGLASGLLIAFITRHVTFHYGGAQAEMVAITCLSFIPYYVCQALEWSGIVGLMFEALVFQLYTWHNISLESKQHLEFTFEVLASSMETAIFVYLGFSMYMDTPFYTWTAKAVSVAISACVFSRFVMTFTLIPLANMFRIEKVELKNQLMFWYSGLRGAIGFALVTNIPRYDPISEKGTKYADELNMLTSSVIIFTIFVQGGLVLPVMQYLDINMTGAYAEPEEEKTADESDEYEYEDTAGFGAVHRFFNNKIHLKYLKPFLVRSLPVEVEIEDQYFTGYAKPERKLSQATFNLVSNFEEKKSIRRQSLTHTRVRSYGTNGTRSPAISPVSARRQKSGSLDSRPRRGSRGSPFN